MMKRKIVWFLIFALIFSYNINNQALAADAKKNTAEEISKKAGFTLDKETVSIRGLKKTYHFLIINDMHILVQNEEIKAEDKANVQSRYEDFKTKDGIHSADAWLKLAASCDEYQANAVLLAGDIVDYTSTSNINCLKKGLKKIKTPLLYVRADHDSAQWFTKLSRDKINKLQNSAKPIQSIYIKEYKEFIILGINNSTSQISKSALQKIKREFAKKKPIIVITHVPLQSKVDGGLANASKGAWQNRVLLWGKGCFYEPNAQTKKFLDLVYAKNSPVVAVVGGHLHFKYDCKLNKNIKQYVFDASYKGNVGMLTVKPKK